MSNRLVPGPPPQCCTPGIEHTYDFSADTTALARYLRSGKKIIIWQGLEDMLASHIDTIQAYETMTRQAGRDTENARFYALTSTTAEIWLPDGPK